MRPEVRVMPPGAAPLLSECTAGGIPGVMALAGPRSSEGPDRSLALRRMHIDDQSARRFLPADSGLSHQHTVSGRTSFSIRFRSDPADRALVDRCHPKPRTSRRRRLVATITSISLIRRCSSRHRGRHIPSRAGSGFEARVGQQGSLTYLPGHHESLQHAHERGARLTPVMIRTYLFGAIGPHRGVGASHHHGRRQYRGR
jgi:hypothetical protein